MLSSTLGQAVRDPSLLESDVYHDRITTPTTPPALFAIGPPPMRVFHGATELFGEKQAVEIAYETDLFNRDVIIHTVTLVRRICGRDEFQYDPDGKFRKGPHFEPLEVTRFLDRGQLSAIGAEVIDANATFRCGGRP